MKDWNQWISVVQGKPKREIMATEIGFGNLEVKVLIDRN